MMAGEKGNGMMIQFPAAAVRQPVEAQHSNAYNNLLKFFEICTAPRECSFYLEAAETSFSMGYLTESELLTLRRVGRQKRLDLAQPDEPKKETADAPGVYVYTPEMNEAEPDGIQMRATLSHYGKHYHIDTPLELHGRGITKDDDPPRWREGTREARENWQCYTVTTRAFEKLKTQYKISMKSYLD